MKHTPQTYVLTLNSPSRKSIRLWTGKSIHTLRHCSVKQIGHALMEMQQYVDDLQATCTDARRVVFHKPLSITGQKLVSVSARKAGRTR